MSTENPSTPEQRLAEIRDLRVDSCSADAPYNPDVWALENARGDLLAEVDRLKARVEELSALLIDPDRLTERARELRAIHARDEMDREMDRLADGGDL